MKRTLLLLCFVVLCSGMQAQTDIGLQFQPQLAQANLINPAFLNGRSLTIALPSVANTSFSNSLTYKDLFAKQSKIQRVFTLAKALIQLKEDNNILLENLDIETLQVVYPLGKVTLGFHHSIKLNGHLDFPKTLPQLIWQGNASFIGQSLDLNHDIQLSAYSEYGLSAAMEIAPDLVIGGRVKRLHGMSNFTTRLENMSLHTDDAFFALRLQADYEAFTSNLIEFNSWNDVRFGFRPRDIRLEDLFSKNTGWAVDLGITYTFDKLKVNASVTDVGYIKWQQEVENFTLLGTYEYNGIEVIGDLFNGDTTFGNIFDEIGDAFTVGTDAVSYTNTLPIQFHLGASYELNEFWTFGAAFNREQYFSYIFDGVMLGANVKVLNKVLNLGVTYGFLHQQFDNLGVNVTVQAKPIQLFFATDNILGLLTENSGRVNGRLGLNLIIDKKEEVK